MNLKFKTIRAENFMSFKSLNFDFEQFSGQSVLITGQNDDLVGEKQSQNGCGKSSINNTILFAIYGEILNPVKKLKRMRNWNASVKDDVVVELKLEYNGEEFIILRTLKGKNCNSELKVFKYEKTDDGEEWIDKTLSTIADTQRYIETEVVPCGKEGFLRCIILTADQNYNFFELNKASKNEFFESLFELTTYSDMYNCLHKDTLEQNSSIIALSRTIDSLNENVIKLKNEKSKKISDDQKLKQAKIDLHKFENELVAYEEKHNVTTLKQSIEKELEDYTQKLNLEYSANLEKFDSDHNITKVVEGTIIFNKAFNDKLIKIAVDKFDREENIVVDENGDIVFDNTEYSKLVEQLEVLRSRVDNGNNLIRITSSEIIAIDKQIISLNTNIKLLTQKIDTIRDNVNAHKHITDILCDDCIGNYKKHMKIDNSDELINSYETSIRECQDCISKQEAELEKKKILVDKYNDGVAKLNVTITKCNDRIKDLLAERKLIKSNRDIYINSVTNDISSKQNLLQSERNSYVAKLNAERKEKYSELKIKKTSEYTTVVEEYKKLKDSISSKKMEIKMIESSTSNYDEPIRTLTESLDSTKEKFEEQIETIAHFKALEDILKPDNIRKVVVADMLKELNFRICGYLSKMGSNYICKFDENFDATFTSSNGVEAEYNNFSSGERMRLSIACCFAFRDFMQVRLNIHPNILVIDEYIDSNLDDMAVSGIMDMINYMVGTEKITTFIISHRSEIKQNVFDSEIFVRKKNNNTTLFANGKEIV